MSKRAAPSKTGTVRLQLSGSVGPALAATGSSRPLRGSTTPRLWAGRTGTRSGRSSSGGTSSAAPTAPPEKPTRTVRRSEAVWDRTEKAEGVGWAPAAEPVAVAAPLPLVSIPASPVSRAWRLSV